MIVVKIDMWPYGSEREAYPLEVVRIINDGTGDAKIGNYECGLEGSGRSARVEGFERSRGVKALVVLAIDALLHAKDKP